MPSTKDDDKAPMREEIITELTQGSIHDIQMFLAGIFIGLIIEFIFNKIYIRFASSKIIIFFAGLIQLILNAMILRIVKKITTEQGLFSLGLFTPQLLIITKLK
jgi:hypothetical protein